MVKSIDSAWLWDPCQCGRDLVPKEKIQSLIKTICIFAC